MKLVIVGMVIVSLISSTHSVSAEEITPEARRLNREGVSHLEQKAWGKSFEKFKEAIRLSPNFQLARRNLAIAHNNYGLELASRDRNYIDSLREFHTSLFIDPEIAITTKNLRIVITRLGKNPDDFRDRVTLAEMSEKNNDLPGAIVEYKAAINLNPDKSIQSRLDSLSRRVSENSE